MESKELSRVEQLDLLHNEHGSIVISWDGGHDSGCFELYLGDEFTNYDGFLEEVVDDFADFLDYGSFAGEFSTSGSVEYDPSLAAFVGSNRETFEVSEYAKVDCKLSIPDYLWFDRINILLDCNYCKVKIHIKNGPCIEEHNNIEEMFENIIYEIVGNIGEFSHLYMDIDVNFEDFEHDEKSKTRYFILDTIDYHVEKDNEKSVYFTIEN